MLIIMDNNKIKSALISCFVAGKKAMAAGLSLLFAVFVLLPVTVRAVETNMVEILVQVNREVVKTPDLYKHLTLNMKTADNPEGRGAVEVLNTKMDLLGSEPISIGSFPGPNLYIFFTVTFDGPESTNEYQGATVSTSYEFFSKSQLKLNKFKIITQEGNVFEDMINLNPGDVFEGVAHIDPLSFTLSTDIVVPPTNDPTPVRLLLILSGGLTALLGIQLVIYVRSKRKDKSAENGLQT